MNAEEETRAAEYRRSLMRRQAAIVARTQSLYGDPVRRAALSVKWGPLRALIEAERSGRC